MFKVILDYKSNHVTELKISYFDTILVTSAICILRPGSLFSASEFGNHALYQFQSIGGETEVGSYQPVLFMPMQLKNLV